MSLHVKVTILFVVASLPLTTFCVVALHKSDLMKFNFVFVWSVLAIAVLLGIATVFVGIRLLFTKPLNLLNASIRNQKADVFCSLNTRRRSFIDEIEEIASSFHSTTSALERYQANLQEALVQQNILMYEVHHRVKNNLQIVASLISLQSSRIQQPEAKAEFQAARDRIRTLATLHRHLYAEGELHTINMRSFLEELCEQIFQTMGESINDRIKLEIDAHELKMSSDQAVPMSLIVTEAVSNAVKYAFPAGRHGLISVRLIQEGDTAELSIIDDGVGMPASGMNVESGQRNGIGLPLIRGFARQLGATLRVEEGCGTRYFVRMKLDDRTFKHFDSAGVLTSA